MCDSQTIKDTPEGRVMAAGMTRAASAFATPPPTPPSLETMSAPAFPSIVAERLRLLERELAEVRARVNSLLFVVAGAVVTQLVLRLLA